MTILVFTWLFCVDLWPCIRKFLFQSVDFQLQCFALVDNIGEDTDPDVICEASGGVIAEIFCIYDDASPGAVRESC